MIKKNAKIKTKMKIKNRKELGRYKYACTFLPGSA